MAKYRKKPIAVEAVQYERGMEDGWMTVYAHHTVYSKEKDENTNMKPYIVTLEGNMTLEEGCYIVTGSNGERWAVRKDIFEETYELVEEDKIIREHFKGDN
jgi:hypothetical protein